MADTPVPTVVPFTEDRAANLAAVAAGNAVHFPPDTAWLVEDSAAGLTREFDTEDNARAFWHAEGGCLIERVETAWVLLPGWAERAAEGVDA